MQMISSEQLRALNEHYLSFGLVFIRSETVIPHFFNVLNMESGAVVPVILYEEDGNLVLIFDSTDNEVVVLEPDKVFTGRINSC